MFRSISWTVHITTFTQGTNRTWFTTWVFRSKGITVWYLLFTGSNFGAIIPSLNKIKIWKLGQLFFSQIKGVMILRWLNTYNQKWNFTCQRVKSWNLQGDKQSHSVFFLNPPRKKWLEVTSYKIWSNFPPAKKTSSHLRDDLTTYPNPKEYLC